MKLFQHIQELVEDEDSLVCVLIGSQVTRTHGFRTLNLSFCMVLSPDEVESLTAARKVVKQKLFCSKRQESV